MKNLKFLIVMLALASIINVSVAQTVIYIEPNTMHRVKCYAQDGSSLDIDCDVNLSGNWSGDSQDTLKIPIGTTFTMEGGSPGDYGPIEWMGLWDSYSWVIDNEGSWFVGKLSNVTGYNYIGHFWVKYYDPNSVVNHADKIDIKVYPNPVTDFLVIEYNRDMQWKLMSITGQVLMIGADEKINLSSLRSGYYVLKIRTAEGLVIEKILKQ